MRPAKQVLLVDFDEDKRSELAFVLKVWGFKVTDSAHPGVDLIIARWNAKTKWDGLQKICRCRLLFVARKNLHYQTHPVDLPDQSIRAFANMEQFLDSVREMSARPRGPKKGIFKIAEDEASAIERVSVT